MYPSDQSIVVDIWQKIVSEAEYFMEHEPILKGFLKAVILDRENMSDALSYYLATKLENSAMPFTTLQEVANVAFNTDRIVESSAMDIQATLDRDSACHDYSTPFLYFKGFLALQAHRVAHHLWINGDKSLALLLQHTISLKFAVDIHPAAKIGSGILIDHGTGLVIGETTVVDDCVSIMQSVTLGGTGKEAGDRHPKICRGVLLGPGAKILGNIKIAEGSMVAASSVVLKSVAPHSIVAGVPAKVVGYTDRDEPSKGMNHHFSLVHPS